LQVFLRFCDESEFSSKQKIMADYLLGFLCEVFFKASFRSSGTSCFVSRVRKGLVGKLLYRRHPVATQNRQFLERLGQTR